MNYDKMEMSVTDKIDAFFVCKRERDRQMENEKFSVHTPSKNVILNASKMRYTIPCSFIPCVQCVY